MTGPLKVPAAGVMVSGGKAGRPGRLLIQAATTVRELVSTTLRASGGIFTAELRLRARW